MHLHNTTTNWIPSHNPKHKLIPGQRVRHPTLLIPPCYKTALIRNAHTQSLNWVLSFSHTSVFPPSWRCEWLSLCADWVSVVGSSPFDSWDSFKVSHTDPGSVEGANQLDKQYGGTESREACVAFNLSIIFQICGCGTSRHWYWVWVYPPMYFLQQIFLIISIQLCNPHSKGKMLCNHAETVASWLIIQLTIRLL